MRLVMVTQKEKGERKTMPKNQVACSFPVPKLGCILTFRGDWQKFDVILAAAVETLASAGLRLHPKVCACFGSEDTPVARPVDTLLGAP
jgi:hypothetical protein